MHFTPVCLLLSCLRLSPDRTQFFKHESLSLTCDNQLNSTSHWRVKRKTAEGGVRQCGSGWGSAFSGSGCTIGSTYPSDSGVYWCESTESERSNTINITITGGSVILVSPALPVMEGDSVTMQCRPETNTSLDFYKDGLPMGRGAVAQVTIHSVSKSDEGFYKCVILGSGESAESWLSVKASLSLPPAAFSYTVTRMMYPIVVWAPFLLSTIILGLIIRDRKKAQTDAERRGSDEVVMDIVV
ncbi:Fc receptor-like protein 5 [Genypterus blacodes]|uniref:Fc receptor-like protein 5 n=1 Tax=Genypterus blacodes TaxID=154954 RepID=UPI003F76F7C2